MSFFSKKKDTRSDTQNFVDIDSIVDEVVILKDGSLRSVVECRSVNFELKSSDEKTAIIQGFQNFVNLMDFPIQILISSKKLDIKPYMEKLALSTQGITNELLKVQAMEYAKFIGGLTELYDIVSKRFFVVVPYYMSEIAFEKVGIKDKILSIFAPASTVRKLSEQELEKYSLQLRQRSSLVRQGLEGLGIKTELVMGDDLAWLYYSYYNPKNTA